MQLKPMPDEVEEEPWLEVINYLRLRIVNYELL
jgi:hypothetical protein